MTASTTFDRVPALDPVRALVDRGPLTERMWFRMVRVVFIAAWLGACVFMLALLAN